MTFDSLVQSLQILWLSSYHRQMDPHNFSSEVIVIVSRTILDEKFHNFNKLYF
jgi:hypothetical protein